MLPVVLQANRSRKLWSDLNHLCQSTLGKIKYISLLFILLIFSCEEESKTVENPKWSKEQSVQLGEELAKEEEIRIQLYIERHAEYSFTKTGSGLNYTIVEKGNGTSFAEEGDEACIDLKIMLLDNTVCYETKEDECVELKVDQSEAESGLQEALKLLKEGDRAMLLIPSHLAHGLIGDQDKIPPLSTLLVDVTLSELEK